MNAKVYSLEDDQRRWLAEVVITEHGMFAAVSEYGNFAFVWRQLSGDFVDFLIKISPDYFADKMQQGLAYVISNQRTRVACRRFAERILPPLQAALKSERDYNKDIEEKK